MNDKYIELAKKLKGLAEQGEGGEKYNAQKKLQSLMKRYDITDDDIAEDARDIVKFRVRKEQVRLFFQVYISVTGYGRSLRRWRKPPYFLIGEVTPLEELEIWAKFDFYWKLYQQNLDTFFAAFVHKNQLYSFGGPSSPEKETTPEQEERIQKIVAMMQGIKTAPYLKQLK